jgi:hypothetical protein
MNFFHSIIFFDISTVIIIFILAYLSKSLGDALKIPPYYKILYIASFSIAFISITETIGKDIGINFSFDIYMILRFILVFIAFIVCLKYWKWVFIEYFKK